MEELIFKFRWQVVSALFGLILIGAGIFLLPRQEGKVEVIQEEGSIQSYQEARKEGPVNINTATKSELERLWGIGPVTAQKIIEGRPYSAVEELLTRKILKRNVFEANRDKLSVE